MVISSLNIHFHVINNLFNHLRALATQQLLQDLFVVLQGVATNLFKAFLFC